MKPLAAICFASLALLTGCLRRSLPVATRPQRIVSVTITGDVLLQALVDSSRVLAVSALADDSGIHEAAGLFPGKPRVGADLERIVSLRPDLVLLGSFHDPAFVDGIRRSGILYEILDNPNSLAKIRDFLHQASARLGEPAQGDSLVRWMDSILDAARVRASRCPDHPRVLYWSEGYTAGDSTTIGDLLALVGARNAASELRIHGSQPISVEDVVKLSPDWILRSGWEAGGKMKPLPQALLDLSAVRTGRVAVVPGKILLSTSHHVALAADSLLRRFDASCK
ncbi:MAG TPA: ABC transporter substrate-binding protein [Fibrobacteria bacterium]|nr:ABC transporter substrate-binding protein [Fibrobacteria bacterium]